MQAKLTISLAQRKHYEPYQPNLAHGHKKIDKVFEALKQNNDNKSYKGIMVVVQQQWHWYREHAILSILYTSPKWGKKQGIEARSRVTPYSKVWLTWMEPLLEEMLTTNFITIFLKDGFMHRLRYMDIYLSHSAQKSIGQVKVSYPTN